jgi:anaerobic ribonucleoside-triphosphate reductase
MHIEIKLDKDFEDTISELKHKYPKEMFHLKGIAHKQLSYTEFIDNFIDVTKNKGSTSDTSVDPNSNVSTKDMVTLLNEMAKPSQKLLSLNKLFYEAKKQYGLDFAKEWLELEINHTIYMSDLNTATFFPYCYNYDIGKIAHKGLFFLKELSSTPPAHFDTFVSATLEAIVYFCNSTSGATGLASWLCEANYFWQKDKKEGYGGDPERYKNQQFQNFYYSINQPYTRSGIQSAFINLNLMDRNYIVALFGDKFYPDGTPMIDCVEDIMEFQKDFMKFLVKERQKKFMVFPVLCACLLYQDGKFIDEEFAKFCVDINMNYYDYNFYISKDVDSLASCCKLTSSTKSLGMMNGVAGSDLDLGSVKVSSINLVRIAHETSTIEEYLERLKYLTQININILDVQRNIIKRNIEKGLLPLYDYEIINMARQYSTIGVLGIKEVLDKFGLIEIKDNKMYYSKEGVEFSEKIMKTLNDIKDSQNLSYQFNVEFIAGETIAWKFSKADKLLYGDKVKDDIYGNQYIPLWENTDLSYRIELASILDKYSQGGCSTHLNLESGFSNFEQAWELIKYIASKEVSLFCFNHKINICEDSHGFIGTNICPECGKPVYDTMQKIVGYMTASKHYSKERKEEFNKRIWVNVNEN